MKEKIKIKKQWTMAIDIDAQKGFTSICPDELPVKNGDRIVPELNANAEFASLRIGSKDWHPTTAVWIADEENPIFSEINGHGLNVDIRWPAHCLGGTKGAELLDGLPEPNEYDFFIWKGMEPNLHPYGIFYHDLEEQLSTGMMEYLLANIEIDTFLVGGLATDYCVYETTKQLLKFLEDSGEFDCRVILNLKATKGVDSASTAKALEHLKGLGVIFIKDTSELELDE